MNPEIEGREFDWFAVDNNGQIALISTAGRGNVPSSVLKNTEQYDLLSEQLETPNWGTKQIWDNYANYGLFVFDWQLNDGPYKKVTEPKSPISQELKSNIEKIFGLPLLNVDFTNITVLNVENT